MRLTQRAHEAVTSHLSNGGIAIDATAGNGYDSAFLARLCGKQGHVYAFDIQGVAIDATRRRLQENNLADRVTLIEACHSVMAERIPTSAHGRVKAVMFNLGFLPGSDKQLISDATTTLKAIDAALGMLAADGIVSVMAYRGHTGGADEAQAVARHIAQLCAQRYVTEHAAASGDGPVLWLIRPRQRDL